MDTLKKINIDNISNIRLAGHTACLLLNPCGAFWDQSLTRNNGMKTDLPVPTSFNSNKTKLKCLPVVLSC